jgi:hypothetical protein
MNNHNNYTRDSAKLAFIAIPAIILQFLLYFQPAMADNVITSGATVRINSGIFYTTLQNVEVENGGSLTIEGSLILKNNLTNLNTVDTLGTGTIEFSGTTPQSISGNNTIGCLRVNNAAGLDVAGNTTLDTILNLQNGLIRLDTNNLTLGNKAIISGTPTASSMVIATGTGGLRKRFSSVDSFTFPVGDNTGTAEFSPVTIDFTSGTFTLGNYIGVNLTNSAYPGSTGNYLNRYWSLTQNGITGVQYDAVFQYVPADINGTESEINCVKVDPLPVDIYNPANTTFHQLSANGLVTFGIFTGAKSGIPVNFSLANLTIEDGTTECFNAYDTIFVAGSDSVVFKNGSSVELIAEQTIIFLPGFHAYEGSQIFAHITTDSTFCDGVTGITLVDQPQDKSIEEKPLPEKQTVIPEEKSIKVYPNPNNGLFSLQLTNIESGATISVYNMLGARVCESRTTNSDSYKVNLPFIKSGIYFLKVLDGKEQITKKIIVN